MRRHRWPAYGLDLGRRTNGALVLAIQGRSGLIANPNGSTRLEAGQRLIVMEAQPTAEMERLWGEALEDASKPKAWRTRTILNRAQPEFLGTPGRPSRPGDRRQPRHWPCHRPATG